MTNLRTWLSDYAELLKERFSQTEISRKDWEAANTRFTEIVQYLRTLPDEPTRKQALDDVVRLSEEVGGYDLPVQSSEPTRDLTSSEAASFERTRARSPRRIQAQCARCGGIGEHQPWCHTYP